MSKVSARHCRRAHARHSERKTEVVDMACFAVVQRNNVHSTCCLSDFDNIERCNQMRHSKMVEKYAEIKAKSSLKCRVFDDQLNALCSQIAQNQIRK